MGPTSPERGTKLGEGAGPRAEPGHTQCTNGPAAGGLGELGPCEHPHASPLAPALSWGGFPHCWHPPQLPCRLERAGAHPHPYGTAGAGIIPNPCQHREQETPLGGTVLGAARPPPAIPITLPHGIVTPEVSPRSGSVGEAECAAGMLPSHKALRRPAASPRRIPHNCPPHCHQPQPPPSPQAQKAPLSTQIVAAQAGRVAHIFKGAWVRPIGQWGAPALRYWALVELGSVPWDTWGTLWGPSSLL